jgi:hypothetical protein
MREAERQIGLDISTLEAIQSLFDSAATDRLADPWALECLCNWIDVTVNQDRTLYALPKALGSLDQDVVFPAFLCEVERNELIRPIDDDHTADRIQLPLEEIIRLYHGFDLWAGRNADRLRQWLHFTTSVRRIVAGRFIDEGELNRWVRDTFWHTARPPGWLSSEGAAQGINSDAQLLAFDMVVRAAQYHVAFGESRAYQPHPIRDLYIPQKGKASPTYSWGRALINHIAHRPEKWDMMRLVGKVAEIRCELRAAHATAVEIMINPAEGREKLNAVAVKVGIDILRGRSRGQEFAEKGLDMVVAAASLDAVGVIWGVVSIPIMNAARRAVQHLKFVQRRVQFPGEEPGSALLAEVRSKLQ